MTTKAITVIVTIAMFSMTIPSALASHGDGTPTWTESSQEFFCTSSLSNLSTTTAIEPVCDEIEDQADAWTNLSGSSWSLTKTTSSAIDQKGSDLGSDGPIAKTNNFSLFGTLISSNIEYNTQYVFGDANVDSDVFDFPTTSRHELGHLLQLNHNTQDNDSVMKAGLAEDEVRKTITSHDEDEAGDLYP